jgi:class 3 adenylate cyclase
MTAQTNIEILVQQGGRWTIHGRYPVSRKDAAIEEAKALDKTPGIGAVKVIKEVYDPDEGVSNEYVIYKSAGAKMGAAGPTAKTPASAARPAARGGGGGGAPSVQGDSFGATPSVDKEGAASSRAGRPRKPEKPSSFSSVVFKLLMVLIFSIGTATAFTYLVASTLTGSTFMGISLVGDSGANFFFLVFVVVFLISAGIMAFAFLRKEQLADADRPRVGTRVAETARKPAAVQPTAEQAPVAVAEQEFREAAAESHAQAGSEAQPPATAEEKPAEEPAARGVVLEAEAYGKKEAPPPDSAAALAALQAAQEPLSPQAEKQKAYMMKFLAEGLEAVRADNKKLDNFSKFGVNLFLAGACEVMAQKRGLDVKSRSRILSDSVQVMGFKREHAMSFAENYEGYLLQDARYMQMFQAGRNAMNTYFTDEGAGPKHLQTALTDWAKPKPKEEESKVITVMFTDMVGSTALTQTRGQAVAQQVVRAHNRIVREALTQFAGKEIKHTGDGIMCSFAQASGAVDAAIQIQKAVYQHNKDNPDLPLHLKIGLNTGEPIAEDGDLFGSTVQLAARITDKAQADEIFVPESVRMVCAGKAYKFVNRGGYAMKGFEGDITLFEVVWDDAFYAQKEAAKAKAQQAAQAAQPAAAQPAAPPTPAPTSPPLSTAARPAGPTPMPPRPATPMPPRPGVTPAAPRPAGAAPVPPRPAATAPPRPAPGGGPGGPAPAGPQAARTGAR